MQHISHELDQSLVVNSFVSSNHGHFLFHIAFCCCRRRRCVFFLFIFSFYPDDEADDVSLLIIFIVQQQSFIIFLYPFSVQSFASLFFSIFNIESACWLQQQQSKSKTERPKTWNPRNPVSSSNQYYTNTWVCAYIRHEQNHWTHWICILLCCCFRVLILVMTEIETNYSQVIADLIKAEHISTS